MGGSQTSKDQTMIARIIAQHIVAQKTKEKAKKDQTPKKVAIKPKNKKKPVFVPVFDTDFKKGF